MPFDLRDVFKSLRRTPGYSVTVVLTLALTIGATTAVFSIVNGVLLKPLAYRESHRLVAMQEVWRPIAAGPIEVNEQHFEYWRAHAQSFVAMAQYIARPANLTGVGPAVQISLGHASGSLFEVLQLQAALGRTLTPLDERADQPRVAVITDGWWRQKFAGASAIVGRAIVIDGRPYTIVGVLPAGFAFPGRADQQADAFVPIRMAEENVGWAGDHNNAAIGRLNEGVGIDAAQAELDVLQRQVAARATAEAHEPIVLASAVVPLAETIVGHARRGLLLLLAAIAAVLLIACSNLANLALTRAVVRQRDAAIRAALGASRARLCARALVEQLSLSTAGGVIGWWVAWAAIAVFVRTAPIDLPRAGDVRLDATVLAFAVALTIVAAVLVAVGPAWRVAGAAAQPTLRASGSALTSDRSALATRSTLLALQVALSVTLLVVTALLGVSFLRLMNVDRGFDAARVLTVPVSLPSGRYSTQALTVPIYDRMLAAVRVLPGVEAASTTSMAPMRGQGQTNAIVPDGDHGPRAGHPTANFRFVSPDFFRALGMIIVRGRSFTDAERDPARPLPAVISAKAASRLWPNGDGLGKRFSRGVEGEQPFEVVGIVANERTTSLETEAPPMVYIPYWWWQRRTTTTLMVRTATDPSALTASVRRAIAQVDPDIAVGDARPLERLVEASLASRRYQARLFVGFGVTALAIAIVGVYGVTAYGVSRRRREMNIRMALGADRSQVTRLVVRQGFAPVGIGIGVGVLGAIAIGGIVASLLFDVRPRDPIVMAMVAAVVAVTAAGACVTAARQNLLLNPAAALREE